MTDTASVYAEVVAARISARAFKPESVPQADLDQVFSVALRAPSNCNTQPWQVHVASGDKVEELRQRMPAEFMEGKMSMDFPYDEVYDGVYKER